MGLLAILAATAFFFGVITAVAGQLSALDPSKQRNLEADGYVYAGDGHTILAVLRGEQSRVLVSSDQISPYVKQAIVAAEDQRFFEHKAIDMRGMLRAVWADIRHKAAVQGGSTITQQYVKNVLTHNEPTLQRKLKEAALAWQLEQRWDKVTILTAYLNTIYFGNGAYGIERAARTYFGHSAAPGRMTLAEAALLAGIPEDPNRYDPVTHPTIAKARRALVLRLMLQQGRITRHQYEHAAAAPMPNPDKIGLSSVQGAAPYFGEYVKQQLLRKYKPQVVFGGGLKVYTTVDLRLQKLGHQAIEKWLPDPNGPRAALVAINPTTGAVLAMVGGDKFRESQFNLAVQGERQPGSSFKPFVLATALLQGISPTTIFDSHPVSIFLGDRYWRPQNFDNEYLGPISLATATTVSDNSVFAQLTRLVGPWNVADTAHKLGITTPLARRHYAIGLGVEQVNPLEMARAYSAFANGGFRIDGSVFGNQPRAVTRVVFPDSKNGTQVNKVEPRRVLTPDKTAILTSLLQGVVRAGTGKAAALPDRPVAGKTGTTENYGDAWFVGYTPQLAVAVWVGYPKTLRPMETEYRGGPVEGGTFPALIWKSFMQSADKLLTLQPESFPVAPVLYSAPKRVVWRNGVVELDAGACPDPQTVDYFGNEGPTRVADCRPGEMEVPNVVSLRLDKALREIRRQRLRAQVVWKPATATESVGRVLTQIPSAGTLAAGERVTIVLARKLTTAVTAAGSGTASP
jgi:penicillin-binding protein 1A